MNVHSTAVPPANPRDPADGVVHEVGRDEIVESALVTGRQSPGQLDNDPPTLLGRVGHASSISS